MARYVLSILKDGQLGEENPVEGGVADATDDILLRAVGDALPRLAQALFQHVIEFRLADTTGLTIASLLFLGTRSLPAL